MQEAAGPVVTSTEAQVQAGMLVSNELAKQEDVASNAKNIGEAVCILVRRAPAV